MLNIEFYLSKKSILCLKLMYSFHYSDLVGGVLSITKNNFILVNGYSNLYWGWGGKC